MKYHPKWSVQFTQVGIEEEEKDEAESMEEGGQMEDAGTNGEGGLAACAEAGSRS